MSEAKGISLGTLHTLSVAVISYEKMKGLKWRDREPAKVLQNFIDRNRESFDFLGIHANIAQRDYRPVVELHTSQYVGAAPLYSPMSGKPVGDLEVSGRFGEDAADIVAYLGDAVNPEYSASLRLTREGKVLPPVYLECVRYLQQYLEVRRFRWRKFKNTMSRRREPSGSTLWGEYALRTAADPRSCGVFVNKRNVLTCDHPEWRQLSYVAEICIRILKLPTVPVRFKHSHSALMEECSRILREVATQSVKCFAVNMSDPVCVRHLKTTANKVLQRDSTMRIAWKIDFNEVFERYVQDVFEEVARRASGRLARNPRYRVCGRNLPRWSLRYLEPDMVIDLGDRRIPVDAKYKSHLYNVNLDSDTETLKDAFRHDMHQVLAYMSFSECERKEGVLAYPASDFYCRRLSISSPASGVVANLHLVGLPLQMSKRCPTVESVLSLLRKINYER
ncbi:MAG: hypothetical protein NC418_04365 [Muribaculaceae bacterium]|nr:hypothetical protein [Muribaculaceae bacterium]